jgi:hypothetical protein
MLIRTLSVVVLCLAACGGQIDPRSTTDETSSDEIGRVSQFLTSPQAFQKSAAQGGYFRRARCMKISPSDGTARVRYALDARSTGWAVTNARAAASLGDNVCDGSYPIRIDLQEKFTVNGKNVVPFWGWYGYSNPFTFKNGHIYAASLADQNNALASAGTPADRNNDYYGNTNLSNACSGASQWTIRPKDIEFATHYWKSGTRTPGTDNKIEWTIYGNEGQWIGADEATDTASYDRNKQPFTSLLWTWPWYTDSSPARACESGEGPGTSDPWCSLKNSGVTRVSLKSGQKFFRCNVQPIRNNTVDDNGNVNGWNEGVFGYFDADVASGGSPNRLYGWTIYRHQYLSNAIVNHMDQVAATTSSFDEDDIYPTPPPPPPPPPPSSWVGVGGAAYDIGAGGDKTWIIGTNPMPGGYGIYHWSNGNWIAVDGGAVRIAVAGDGNPWIVNSGGNIFQRSNGVWSMLPGLARDIGVGHNGKAWIIGTNAMGGGYGIYHWDGSNWLAVDGSAERIAVGADGNPWIVNSGGNIFLRQNGAWTAAPGLARDIGVGANGRAWIIGTNAVAGGYGIYYFSDNCNWIPVDGGGVAITVNPWGVPWMVNSAGNISYRP